MNSLANELLVAVFRWVSPAEIIDLRRVSRKWRDLITDDIPRRLPEYVRYFNNRKFIPIRRVLRFQPDLQLQVIQRAHTDSLTVVNRCVDMGWFAGLSQVLQSQSYWKWLREEFVIGSIVDRLTLRRDVEGLRLIYTTCLKNLIPIVMPTEKTVKIIIQNEAVEIVELWEEFGCLPRYQHITAEAAWTGNCRLYSVFKRAGMTASTKTIETITMYNYQAKYSEMYTLLTGKTVNIKNTRNLDETVWPALGK